MSLDEYERLKVIGKGSYGEVWLAKHKSDRKQYVLKKMDLRKASKKERLAAEQEAKLLSNLRHPNIVAYKDTFEGGDGYLYIAMGYCEKGDLYSKLKELKGVPLEERQVVEWFVQIAMALQYMHERNILHRDLKTQNIFLTKNKIIKVGDLGIARVLDSSSDMATTLIGTPYYMSPELFSNKPYNFKSDVWALGCCVYEMTTLKHAFNAKDMNALMYRVLRGKLPPMPDMYRKELVDLIKAMLNKSPDKRPSVNRILRDPYIKENIAIFLEGTKNSINRRPDSAKKERLTTGDGNRPRKPKSDPLSLEPLNTSPDGLEPIKEECTPRESIDMAGSSNRSRNNTGKGSEEPGNSGSSEAKFEKNSKKDQGINSESEARHRPLPPRPLSSSVNPEHSRAVTSRSARSVSSGVDSGHSTSTSSSGYSAKEELSDAPDDRILERISRSSQDVPVPRQSIESNARQRRRQQQLQQQANTPRMSKSIDVSVTPLESFRGSFASDAGQREQKSTNYEHYKSSGERNPSREASCDLSSIERERLPSVHPGRNENGNSSEPEEEDNSRRKTQEKEENKEISRFINLLGTTLLMKKTKDSDDEIDGKLEGSIEESCSSPKPVYGRTYLMPAPSPLPLGSKYPYIDESSRPLAKSKNSRQKALQESPVVDRDSEVTDKLDSAISMTSTGRLFERIALLRRDCIHALGVQKLKIAYDILECFDTDELEPKLIDLLGQEAFDAYAGKIWQLKFCEDSAFRLQ